jgi:hypothetical protein
MDLDTFLTTLYVLVDDWYQTQSVPAQQPRAGAPVTMSDSEVLTVAVAGQWRVGVPWQSERGVVRYMQAHGRGWFPTMLERSAFNQRVRNLCGMFIRLQQAVETWLQSPEDVYQVLDSVPLIAFSNSHAQRTKHHWLWQSSLGHGGTQGGWFYGDHLLLSVQRNGAVSGWVVGAAHLNDRWLVEAFLSARTGQPQLQGPPPNAHEPRSKRPLPPGGHVGAWIGVGAWTEQPYLADRGLNGRRWRDHWRHTYGADVIAIPPRNAPEHAAWTRPDQRWHAHHRQIVDTAFAFLDSVFHIEHLQAHSRWGQYTRIAAKTAAYNLGLFINRLLDRPLHALATLLC